MSMNKQTVWLVAMLSLMVVLSTYYIVTGPIEPVKQAAQPTKNEGEIEVNIKTVDEVSDQAKNVMGEQTDDYFINVQLQRSTLRQKMVEDYMKVLTDPNSTEKEMQEANSKIQELMKVDNQESALEDLIRKEGYRDAVVTVGDPHVDVIVQADKLTAAQAVNLIEMVKKHLQISSQHISIAYRP